jgi:hypothetical protein
MTVRARLFMKPNCHLCEDVVAHLERLQPELPHELEQVDISADADLLQRYGLRIPVLELAGHEYAAPLPPSLLERALREAAQQR